MRLMAYSIRRLIGLNTPNSGRLSTHRMERLPARHANRNIATRFHLLSVTDCYRRYDFHSNMVILRSSASPPVQMPASNATKAVAAAKRML